MFKFLAAAGVTVLLSAAAPVPPVPSATPASPAQAASDDCYNCILVCWKMTGDWGACEIACMDSLQCPPAAAAPALKVSRIE